MDDGPRHLFCAHCTDAMLSKQHQFQPYSRTSRILPICAYDYTKSPQRHWTLCQNDKRGGKIAREFIQINSACASVRASHTMFNVYLCAVLISAGFYLRGEGVAGMFLSGCKCMMMLCGGIPRGWDFVCRCLTARRLLGCETCSVNVAWIYTLSHKCESKDKQC